MITDFVHLDWMFVEKDGYPEDDGHYLCLIREDEKCRLLMLWFNNDDKTFDESTFDDFTYEPVFVRYSGVIAWANPYTFTFTCDPDKHEECDKTFCSYSFNPLDISRGLCCSTRHLKYAKDYDFH